MASNDNDIDLLRSIATDWYNIAIDAGLTGFNPPSIHDNRVSLLSKITYYTARIAAS